jgi:ankyrin repeat protein
MNSLANACWEGDYESVKLFIKNGANVDISIGQPLQNACYNGHYNIVKLLIEKRAPNDIYIERSLLYACFWEYCEIVKLLLTHLPKKYKPYISIDMYSSNIWKIFNEYDPIIYQLNGTIKYLPDIITFKSALFIGIL